MWEISNCVFIDLLSPLYNFFYSSQFTRFLLPSFLNMDTYYLLLSLFPSYLVIFLSPIPSVSQTVFGQMFVASVINNLHIANNYHQIINNAAVSLQKQYNPFGFPVTSVIDKYMEIASIISTYYLLATPIKRKSKNDKQQSNFYFNCVYL